jgi:dolichyl-phosphate-mannose--protein O-mannosyl transferase
LISIIQVSNVVTEGSGSRSLLPIAVLVLLGGLMRIPFLGHPNSVVFDEVHFGKYVSAYCCTHERFFDIHPPHAKLLVAGAVKLAGYDGRFAFDRVGREYPDDFPAFAMRLLPAIAGVLLPAAVFVLLRLAGGSEAAAFAAGLLVLFDNAIWVQTRILALDGVLWFGMFAALGSLLRAQQHESMHHRIGWLLLCGVALGFAVGAKLTGLATGVLVLALLANEWLDKPSVAKAILFIRQCIWVGFPFLMVYLAGWVLHFELLTRAGEGDAFFRPTGHFFYDLLELHRRMLSANYGLTASHPDASPWWSWPFVVTPVFYWEKEGSLIYLVGNPVVWWGTTAIGLTALMIRLLRPVTMLRLPPDIQWRTRVQTSAATTLARGADATWESSTASGNPRLGIRLAVIGFVVSYLPLAGIPRVLFLYHYIPSLLFASMFAIMWLERCGWTEPTNPINRQPWRYWSILALVLCGFLLLLPLSGGFGGFGWWRSFLFWVFPGWA